MTATVIIVKRSILAVALVYMILSLTGQAQAAAVTVYVNGSFETGGGSDLSGGSFDGSFTVNSATVNPGHFETITSFLVVFYNSSDDPVDVLDSSVGGPNSGAVYNQRTPSRGEILIDSDGNQLALYFAPNGQAGAIDLSSNITITSYSAGFPSTGQDASGAANVGSGLVSPTPPPTVPEPSSAILASLGLLGTLALAKSRRPGLRA